MGGSCHPPATPDDSLPYPSEFVDSNDDDHVTGDAQEAFGQGAALLAVTSRAATPSAPTTKACASTSSIRGPVTNVCDV